MREQLTNTGASVGNRGPPHGARQRLTSASLSERSEQCTEERSERRCSFFCLIARWRSLRIALGSRLLCRRSPKKGVSARSSATHLAAGAGARCARAVFSARRRAIRCERRRRRRILDVRAADLQDQMAEQRFSVPSARTKTAATQRTSQSDRARCASSSKNLVVSGAPVDVALDGRADLSHEVFSRAVHQDRQSQDVAADHQPQKLGGDQTCAPVRLFR